MIKTFPILACLFAALPLTRAAEPATTRSSTPHFDDFRHGHDTSGTPEERRARFFKRVIEQIQPTTKGDIARLPQYIGLFQREFVDDTRTFAFSVTGEAAGERAIVTGHFEFQEHKDALIEFFKQLEIPLDDRTELLPSKSLGEQRYGVVTSRAYVYDRSAGRRETFTECVENDIVYLLKEDQGHLLCHAPSGYVGYIPADRVQRLDESQLNAMLGSQPNRRTQEIESAVATATKLLGTNYVWGGVSDGGIDCSGLVYNSYRSIGVQMPRDANQQYLAGRLVGTRWHRAGLRRGDTLYFLSRRGGISHTAMYLGDNKYIEATSPVVRITSFDPKDPEYHERRAGSFCFAKRVIE
jgi:cell wall-associated NlpC family hydrolase